eukprot:scaffold19493_cov101-Isochrysis_galbana.AAC.1
MASASETGHGPHRRSFRVFDKSAKTSQQTSTLCSSGFLEPRTSKIYLLAGPLAQKGHWQVPETGPRGDDVRAHQAARGAGRRGAARHAHRAHDVRPRQNRGLAGEEGRQGAGHLEPGAKDLAAGVRSTDGAGGAPHKGRGQGAGARGQVGQEAWRAPEKGRGARAHQIHHRRLE